MKLRIIYNERGIEHRTVIAGESKALILDTFKRAYPGGYLVRVEEILPPPPSAQRAIRARQDSRPQTSDAELDRLRDEARRLTAELKEKLSRNQSWGV